MMGIGTRIFLIDENDSLHRISISRYNKMRNPDSDEFFTQYAGKRVRCAMIFLEVENRKPLSVVRTEYYYLPFDNKGRIDSTEMEKRIRLSLEIVPPIFEEQSPKKILDAQSRFAKKLYKHEFQWTPNQEIETAIMTAIFSKNMAP
jgi:hypothetical protein